jgi:Domain of Unknown Function (DUF1080)
MHLATFDRGIRMAAPIACAVLVVSMALFAQDGGRAASKAAQSGGSRGGRAMPGQQPIEEVGFQAIFDGSSMKGWDCDPDFWRLENGVMVGETHPHHMPKQNIFCIWRDGKPADFDLKLQYRLTGSGGNSGVQYRSIERPDVAKWVMQGYQADIDADERYTGQVYEERGRGFLANRGNFAYVGDGQKSALVGSVGDGNELKKFIKSGDWNDMEVIARGNTMVQLINGHVMSVLIDDDKANRKMDGLIGIQLHVTEAGEKVEARNIRIKNF